LPVSYKDDDVDATDPRCSSIHAVRPVLLDGRSC
jgi:hypothetical protein